MQTYAFSIIIPVFNQWHMTRDCLVSLRGCTPGNDFEVIVVDNASNDETQRELPALGNALFPGRFQCLRNTANKNFAGACNQGARAAAAPFLFFLNNDTLLTRGWSQPLLQALAEDVGLGAAGPLLLYPSGLVQHIGAAHNPRGIVGHFYRFFPGTHPLARKKRSLNVITAAALMLRAKDFFAVQGFHEGYVNGFEDVELSFRLRKAGFTLSVFADSVVYHLEGQTPGRKNFDSANLKMMAARCPEGLQPDLHRIVAADGYLPVLMEDLQMKIILSPERERYLQEKAGKTPDAESCMALLDAEPQWEAGYDHIVAIFQAKGQHTEALNMMDRKLKFFLSTAAFQQALTCTLRAEYEGVEAARSYLAGRIAENAEFLADHKAVAELFYSMLEHAVKFADPELQALLKTWRKTYGPKYLAAGSRKI